MATKYVAYNKLYLNGRPVGRAYKVATEKSEAEAKRKTNVYNKKWNMFEKKEGSRYKAKLVMVKKVGSTTRKKPRPRYAYGLDFGI